MRQAFAHEAILVVQPQADLRAPGAAITVALCGHWEHQPPCPLAAPPASGTMRSAWHARRLDSLEQAFDTVGLMSRNHDRELREARASYVGAVRRLDRAMRRFDESDIPMDPGPGREPYPWTAQHIGLILELREAIILVADTRRDWDRMRREWVAPH